MACDNSRIASQQTSQFGQILNVIPKSERPNLWNGKYYFAVMADKINSHGQSWIRSQAGGSKANCRGSSLASVPLRSVSHPM